MDLDLSEVGSFEEEFDVRGLFDPLEGYGLPSVTPGMFPVVLETENGVTKQVEVSPDVTVKDLKGIVAENLAKNGSITEADMGADFELTFGGTTLGEDDMPLAKSTLFDSYEHAGGFLRAIEKGEEGGNSALKALNSTISVVKNVKEGSCIFDQVVEDALQSNYTDEITLDIRAPDDSPGSNDTRKLSASEARTAAATNAAKIFSERHLSNASRATVPEILSELSKKIPHIFTPKAVASVHKNWEAMTPMSAMASANANTTASAKIGKQTDSSEPDKTWLENVMSTWEMQLQERKTEADELSQLLGSADASAVNSRKRSGDKAEIGQDDESEVFAKRVVTLESENCSLKRQVNEMRNKVELLQNLLTVKVKPV